MLYKLISGRDPFELNEGLKAVEKYSSLTPNQMFYVILMEDPSYDNPIRTLQGKQKMERALMLAGYPMEADGKRLNKNARDIMAGHNKRVNEAVEEFRKNHYNDKLANRDSLVQQIVEIRDFLKSDKREVVFDKNGAVAKNEKGEVIYTMDPKVLSEASKLGKTLPDLIAAKEKLEETLDLNQKFEGTTYMAQDLEGAETEDPDGNQLSTLDMAHNQARKQGRGLLE